MARASTGLSAGERLLRKIYMEVEELLLEELNTHVRLSLHEYDDDGRDKACSDGCIPTMRLTFAIVRSLPFGRVRISLSEK